MPHDYVRIAYDKAVMPDGNPSQRVIRYLTDHTGLSTELLRLVNEIIEGLEEMNEDAAGIENVLLAMFSVGVIFERDFGSTPSVYPEMGRMN